MSRQDLDPTAESWEKVNRLTSEGPCKKKTYRTKRKATVALDRIRASTSTRIGTTTGPRSSYKCKQCGFWHLTSYES